VAKFKWFATTATNQKCLHDKIKSRVQSVNVCYMQLRIYLSSFLPSTNVKAKVYETIILVVVCMNVEPGLSL
jgi:hypothetical protein